MSPLFWDRSKSEGLARRWLGSVTSVDGYLKNEFLEEFVRKIKTQEPHFRLLSLNSTLKRGPTICKEVNLVKIFTPDDEVHRKQMQKI
jgi:hypothetical protein